MRLGPKITLVTVLLLVVNLLLDLWLLWDKIGTRSTPEDSFPAAFLAVGGWTILSTAYAVYFAVRRLTRPLGELSSMAHHLGEGRLEERIHFQTRDEIGELAGTFNQMAASLQSYQDTMEQKVEERTRELKHSQRQLLQATKLASVGELAGGVAHQINNPAGIILMRAGRLAQEVTQRRLSGEAREDVQVIQRQVEKIHSIVSALVKFARQMPTELRPTDLNSVVRRAVALIEELARNRGVKVILDLQELPRVAADGAQLEQVLINLVTNALDAMPAGGILTFATRQGSQVGGQPGVALSVTDTGSGIPAEHLPRLFDPFFTTKEVGKGTGLGLSISYGIVQEHGGTIEVESEPGKGSRFTLCLPALPAS
ncbi:MAG: HAMP domain-containing protein [Candidatus Latescibacteria bacterium]|nr:HAMP domain-containing protein [Candidatus Latescibacterota bacterium]